MGEVDCLLTKKQKAQEMGVSLRTIERWVEEGKVNYIMIEDKHVPQGNRKMYFKEEYSSEEKL